MSDWSSDVCSSDLMGRDPLALSTMPTRRVHGELHAWRAAHGLAFLGADADRKSVVSGKSVSVRVDLGGRRIIKKTKKNHRAKHALMKTYTTTRCTQNVEKMS